MRAVGLHHRDFSERTSTKRGLDGVIDLSGDDQIENVVKFHPCDRKGHD